MRSRPEQALRYAKAKRQHSHLLDTDREAYGQAKAPTVWQLLQEDVLWAQTVGWEPGPSDH